MAVKDKVDVFVTGWTSIPSANYLQQLADKVKRRYPITAERLMELSWRVDDLRNDIETRLALVGELDAD